MYVIDVIPLASTAPPGTLSYRSAKRLSPGRVVTVKLRKRHVPGVVVECTPLVQAKAALKAASFTLSGDIVAEVGSVPEALMEAVARIAAWHATSRGAVFSALFLELIKSDHDWAGEDLESGTGFVVEPVEVPVRTRVKRYREAIAATLEAGEAALLVVSTLAEVEFWKSELGAFAPIVLTGSLTGARRKATLKRAGDAQTLIISTPTFSWVPIARLGRVIVDRISSGAYRQPKRPYLDLRIALEELARARELPLMLGDFPLPLEYRAGIRKLSEAGVRISILDARKDESLPALEDEPWSAIPKKMQEQLRETLETGGRAAVLAVRKGYAPVVVCRDCGETLKDERGKLYAFSVSPSGERTFRTSDGASIMGTNRTCPRCDSWNLLPLGVGVERVHEELELLFPDNPRVLFEADTVRTAAKARKVLADADEPGSIIVGTEAMVPWLLALLDRPLELACIASADTLLALPFWRARERFLRLAYLLAETASETVIATRVPDDTAVQQLADPANSAFFDEELMLRKALGYPPSGTLISITFEARESALDTLTQQAEAAIGTHATIRRIPDRSAGGSMLRRVLVLQLPKDAWPDPALSARLSALPPSARIMIDPESF